MFSHTVPKRLLEEFAYFDPVTCSKRLWRYEHGCPPFSGVSPRKATGIEGYFADPLDEARERCVEEQLANDFESPVNMFLFRPNDAYLAAGSEKRRQLTFYATLLFNRSQARRKASTHLQEPIRQAYEFFIHNQRQVATVAAKINIERLLSGGISRGLVTPNEIVTEARKTLGGHLNESRAQKSYLHTMQRAMSEIDEALYEGDWNCLHSDEKHPFLLSDAPVVTWERLDSGAFSYGLGFHRENVEVALPISPTRCLHILPKVKRTRPVSPPSVEVINRVQAACADRFCYSNVRSDAIQRVMQENFGKAELGVKAFTVWHRDYRSAIYEILMG